MESMELTQRHLDPAKNYYGEKQRMQNKSRVVLRVYNNGLPSQSFHGGGEQGEIPTVNTAVNS